MTMLIYLNIEVVLYYKMIGKYIKTIIQLIMIETLDKKKFKHLFIQINKVLDCATSPPSGFNYFNLVFYLYSFLLLTLFYLLSQRFWVYLSIFNMDLSGLYLLNLIYYTYNKKSEYSLNCVMYIKLYLIISF